MGYLVNGQTYRNVLMCVCCFFWFFFFNANGMLIILSESIPYLLMDTNVYKWWLNFTWRHRNISYYYLLVQQEILWLDVPFTRKKKWNDKIENRFALNVYWKYLTNKFDWLMNWLAGWLVGWCVQFTYDTISSVHLSIKFNMCGFFLRILILILVETCILVKGCDVLEVCQFILYESVR